MKKQLDNESIYLNLETPLEKKLSIMCEEVYLIFLNKSRWDNVSSDDKSTRYEVSEYDFYLDTFLSKIENKKEMYIEYLKCYTKNLSEVIFCPEEIPNEYEFIKKKCIEVNLESVFESYYERK